MDKKTLVYKFTKISFFQICSDVRLKVCFAFTGKLTFNTEKPEKRFMIKNVI